MAKLFIVVLITLTAVLAAGFGFTRWQTARISARFPPAGAFVSVQGVKLHFTDTKPAGEPQATVLLVHGASGNEREMRAALGGKLHERGYRVISIDRPGLGHSKRPETDRPSTPATQAALIRQALEAHGADRVIVVAHSLAGALGLQLALDHDDFAVGVVLIAPATHPWPGGVAAYNHIAASPAGIIFNNTIALPAGQTLLEPALKSVFAPQSPPPNYLQQTGITLTLRPENFANNARDIAGLHAFVSAEAPRYKNIRTPISIVSGDADTVVLTGIHSRNTARDVPGAELTILPGVGHAPHWVQPDAVLAAIDRVRLRSASRQVQSAR